MKYTAKGYCPFSRSHWNYVSDKNMVCQQKNPTMTNENHFYSRFFYIPQVFFFFFFFFHPLKFIFYFIVVFFFFYFFLNLLLFIYLFFNIPMRLPQVHYTQYIFMYFFTFFFIFISFHFFLSMSYLFITLVRQFCRGTVK